MNLKILLAIFFLYSSISVFASGKLDNIVWHDGTVYMEDDSFINGQISYDHQNQIVLIKNKEKIVAYTSHQVMAFVFFDEHLNVNRRYVAVDYHPLSYMDNYKAKVFFEIILEGKLSLLRKEKKFANFNNTQGPEGVNITRHSASFDYFVHFKDQFYRANFLKKEIIKEEMELNMKEVVMAYIRKNGLNLNLLGHMVLAIDYYNKKSLEDSEQSELTDIISSR